jgi:flagellar hook-associated protein 2
MASVASFSGLASGIQWRDMVTQIMEIESARKLTPISNRAATQQDRADAWKRFEGLIRDLSTATTGLKDGTAFGQFGVTVPKSPTTDKELLTAAVTSAAAPGSYAIEVRAIAQQEKIRSTTGVSSLSEARGLSGDFLVGGRSVSLSAGDSLTGIRDKINAVNSGSSPSGVTASIVTVSATEHYLTLTADNSGTRGIELVDSGDGTSTNGVLKQLGLLTGAQSANTSGADTETQRLRSQTTAVAEILGLSSPPALAAINVGGVRVEVDLLSDTLADLLDKIQAAGGTAQIKTEEVAGQSFYRLSTGAVTVNTDPGNDQADSQRIIELLGFARGTAGSTVQSGINSEIRIDGLAVERRTNSISDAVSGMTLSLKAAEIGTTVNVDVRRDTGAIVKKVQAFADAYNKVITFQTQQRSAGGPLATDGTLRAAIAGFKEVLLSDVAGIDPALTTFTRTAIAGVTFTQKGTVEVDVERLTGALGSSFNDVKALFGAAGASTSSNLSYVGAGPDTTPGSYAVSITQLATVGTVAGTGWVGAYDGAGADQMTVVDAFSGKTSVIALAAGATVDSIVSLLNDQFDAQGTSLTASKDGSNQLVITGSKYGATASFTVSYQQSGSDYGGASPTGIAAGVYAGLDVAGTIGGEAATGVGQLLTADDATAAEGLSITYTGNTLGAAGDLTYVAGIGGSILGKADGYIRTGDGLIATYLGTLADSIAALETRQADMQSRLDRYEQTLVKRFIAMESAMSKVQATGSWLTNQIAAMQSSGSQ